MVEISDSLLGVALQVGRHRLDDGDGLLGQRIESRVPVAPPPDARYAHKTGELEGVENDAGLVLLAGRTFALAVLVEGGVERTMPPVAAASRLSARLSRRYVRLRRPPTLPAR